MKLGGDIKQAIESLALDKGVTVDSMYEALVSAFRSAYMRIEGAAEEVALYCCIYGYSCCQYSLQFFHQKMWRRFLLRSDSFS